MSARDMSNLYRVRTTTDLLMLRSKKKSRLAALQRSLSYMDKQEARRIEHNIKQIDAELAARDAQLELF